MRSYFRTDVDLLLLSLKFESLFSAIKLKNSSSQENEQLTDIAKIKAAIISLQDALSPILKIIKLPLTIRNDLNEFYRFLTNLSEQLTVDGVKNEKTYKI